MQTLGARRISFTVNICTSQHNVYDGRLELRRSFCKTLFPISWIGETFLPFVEFSIFNFICDIDAYIVYKLAGKTFYYLNVSESIYY